MEWIVFALLTALFSSFRAVFSKKSLKNMDEYVVAWALRFFALIFLLPLLLFIEIPDVGNQFWLALLIGGGLNALATVLYMKAIKSSDLSKSFPILSFTPVFLLITSPLIIGEFPGVPGVVGIFLIVIGAYTLNIKKVNSGYLSPLRAIVKEQGPRLMLIVAFIWSITSNFDKIGIQNSSSLFWAVSLNIFLTLLMTPIIFYKSRSKLNIVKFNLRILFPLGLLNSLSIISHVIAISLTFVSYVMAIKRTTAIFTVIFGYLIFKETGLKERLLGVIIMVIGVLLITLF